MKILACFVIAIALIGAGCTSQDDDQKGGYELYSSSTVGMATELQGALDNEEWIVVTLWRPHWTFARMDGLKFLDDPKDVYGGSDNLVILTRPGFEEDRPEFYQLIQNYEMDLNDIESIMIAIDEGNEPEEAAQNWLAEHPGKSDEVLNLNNATTQSNGIKEPVKIGVVQWDDSRAGAYVFTGILDEGGYEYETESADVGGLYQATSQGDIDILIHAWLPATQASYWDKYGDSLNKAQVVSSGAKIGLVVPDYVYDSGITTVEDLKGNASKFDGRITGIEPGAGIMITTEKALEEYNLSDTE